MKSADWLLQDEDQLRNLSVAEILQHAEEYLLDNLIWKFLNKYEEDFNRGENARYGATLDQLYQLSSESLIYITKNYVDI